MESEIQESAYGFQKAVESGEQVIVGMNRFQSTGGEKAPGTLLRVDPAVGAERVAAWKSFGPNAIPPEFRPL